MKTAKPMNKAFIAKLLVLCMIVGLLPVSALAAGTNVEWEKAADNSVYYAITDDTEIGAEVLGSNAANDVYYIYADAAAKNPVLTLKGTTLNCTLYVGTDGTDGTQNNMKVSVDKVKLNGALSIWPNVTIENLTFDYGTNGIALMSLTPLEKGTVVLEKDEDGKSATVAGDIEIPEGVTLQVKGNLEIPANTTLTVAGKLEVAENAEITVENGATLTFEDSAEVTVNGSIVIDEGATFEPGEATVTGDGDIVDNSEPVTYYTVKAAEKPAHGTIEISYKDADGKTVTETLVGNDTYEIEKDTELTVTLKPDTGYYVNAKSTTYTIGEDTEPFFTADGDEDEELTATITVDGDVTISAVFTRATSGSTGGGGVVADTVTGVSDAVTEDGSSVVTIKVNGRVSKGTATASVNDRHLTDAVNKALAAAEKNETAPVVEIVVDTKDAEALKLTLGSDALDKLGANPNAVLKVTSGAANLEFDAVAIAALGDQATGNIVITVAPATGLSDEQKEVVGDAVVYEVTITASGKEITDFDSGNVKIGLPYELAEDQKAADVQVFYLDGTDMFGRTTTYADGYATFTTDHLSLYVIGDTSMSTALAEAADVMSGAWYAEAVKYVYANGLMNGMGNGFAPEVKTTRAMVVTTLYRLYGEPEVTAESKFTDVEADQWYTDAVIWAEEAGVVNGMTETTFEPDTVVTREQMATMLYRYAEKVAKKSVNKTTDLKNYTDADSVSSWALNAVKWANAEGLMKGTSNTELTPGSDMTRAQLATFLMRFDKNIVK